MTRLPWTPAEDAILRAAWEGGTVHDAIEKLRGRSKWAIWRRVHSLGLQKHKPFWTPIEDARLRERWNSGDRIVDIAKSMNRPEAGIYERAQKLGLQLGCPPGFEYLSLAAVRAGVATETLRGILRWADMPIHVATTKDRGRKRRKRRHFVDPSDVVAAMARWNDSEPIAAAARRLGLCAETITRKLKALGYGAERTKKRQHIRVTEDDLRRAGVAA